MDVHPASEIERREIFRNVFDVWPCGRTVEEHVARRLASPSHRRAEWFAGVVDGAIVASLGCHALTFRLHGERVRGFAICSVHTRSDYRSRGLAAELIDRVEQHHSARGSRLALLYSDIGTAYYERLGYRAGPSHEAFLELADAPPRRSPLRTTTVDPREEAPLLRDLYTRGHDGMALFVERDADYWRHLVDRFPDDTFHLLSETDGERLGYVRLGRRDDTAVVRETAILPSQAKDARAELAHVLVSCARQAGALRLRGWVPSRDVFHREFRVRPREREITMLKSLDETLPLDTTALQACNWFHEVDHV